MIRTAMIGMGRIAWELEQDHLRYKPCSHYGAIEAVNKRYKKATFQIDAICDTNPDQIKAFQKQTGQTPKAFTDFRLLLDHTDCDLLVIATWTDSHYQIASSAMKQGLRAIVLEKPVSMHLKESQQLLKLAKKTNTKVWVNFERRYHPAYRLIQQYIEQQKLGILLAIRGRVLTSGSRNKKDTIGPLLHDGIHWLDLLIWYTGMPDTVKARMLPALSGAPIEDTSWIRFDYPDLSAVLESGGRRNYFEFAMELDFKAGRIVASNTGHFYYKKKRSTHYDNFTELKEFPVRIKKSNAWIELYQEVRRFFYSSKPENPEWLPTSNLKNAHQGMQLIGQCYKKLNISKSHL